LNAALAPTYTKLLLEKVKSMTLKSATKKEVETYLHRGVTTVHLPNDIRPDTQEVILL
jgi:hypothetical protein